MRAFLERNVLQPIRAEIKEEFEKYMPLIVEVIVRTMTESAIKLAAEGTDRLTDLIPGELDDQIIDPIARQITDRLGELYRQLGGKK